MKPLFLLLCLLLSTVVLCQETKPVSEFWNTLMQHCGKAYEGKIVAAPENDDFRGKKLIMHIRSCEENIIRIPFFVGDDKSRTSVLTRKNNRIELKHDHRHPDGSADEISMYGGTSPNPGLPGLQIFPADEYTAKLIPAAASNIWWISVNDTAFTYNLKRIGTDRLFTVEFDLLNPVALSEKPWGWKE